MSDKIAAYINENHDEINESNIIVFIDSEAEKNELYNCIEKWGIVCNFERLKLASIAKRLQAIAKAYQVNIENTTLEYFIRKLWNFYARFN